MENPAKYFVSLGNMRFGAGSVTIEDYPFEPSSVFRDPKLPAASIISISLILCPTIRLGDELIPVSAVDKEELVNFARNNKIPTVDIPWIWNWILEPFLDTEFTKEHEERTDTLLAEYGFTKAEVSAIRAEVGDQMIKYNFDTMLWEWVNLDLFDVLCAMRVKYNAAEFSKFYWDAMKIALRPKVF